MTPDGPPRPVWLCAAGTLAVHALFGAMTAVVCVGVTAIAVSLV